MAMKRRSAACRLLLLTLACLGLAGRSAGQITTFGSAAGEGISVSGLGEISERPNMVEIDLQVSGKAELTLDALVKYRDAKTRVLEAIEKLKVPNLSTEERGMSISIGNTLEQQQRFNNGMPQQPGKPQVDVSSSMRIKLANVREMPPEELIRTIGRLMDVAQDSGVSVGPSAAEVQRAMRYGQTPNSNASVRFVLTDLAALREKAYEKAVADAHDRATRLAKLHHVKLGQALSIQEVAVGGDPAVAINYQQQYPGAVQSLPQAEPSEPRIASSTLAGVPVQVKLTVRYAITPSDPATAQK
jgi:uncharacterized protein